MNKTILDDHEHLQEIVKCAILHSKGENRKDIGRKLGISAAKVTRNIQEAMEKRIIKVELHLPPEEEIAEKLREKYALREVHVFPTGAAEESTNTMLTGLSAAYLEKRLDDEREKISCLAIGPGRTMLAFVRALSDEKRSKVRVGSTTSAALKETYMASNILIGILAGKWECELYRFDPEMSPEEQRDYADIFFFGIERIPDIEGVTALVLLFETGIYRSGLEKELLKLLNRGGVGFINYQPIDEEGNPLDWDIKAYNEVLKPTLLKLDLIRKIAGDEKTRVICIAAGADKVKAIRAGLRGGYFNVLITDYETAAAIK